MLKANLFCNPECSVCHYKDLAYPEQLERKQKWATSQLSRWGQTLKRIIAAPDSERLGYRSKSWLRSSSAEGGLSFGMYRSVKVGGKWGEEFISWDTCPLHLESIQKMIANLRTFLLTKFPEIVQTSLEGVWMGNPHIVLVTNRDHFELFKKTDWTEVLVAPFDKVWVHCNPQVGRKVFGHHPILLLTGDTTSKMSNETTAHPIRAFRQVAQSLLSQARSAGTQALLRHYPKLILDLYCGTGDLSLLIPGNVGWIGIESSKEAVQFANTLRNSPSAVHRAFVGAVEQRLDDLNVTDLVQTPYAVYVNPPRSGLTREALEKLLKMFRTKRPQTIVYLSCSASSLSRDLIHFENEGFKIESLQPYDFFPQTEHFETLAVLASD